MEKMIPGALKELTKYSILIAVSIFLTDSEN